MQLVLLCVKERAPAIDAATLTLIEEEIRARHGGERARIAKRRKHPTAEERKQAYQAGLTSAPTEQIAKSFRISGRTLERYMKRGG